MRDRTDKGRIGRNCVESRHLHKAVSKKMTILDFSPTLALIPLQRVLTPSRRITLESSLHGTVLHRTKQRSAFRITNTWSMLRLMCIETMRIKKGITCSFGRRVSFGYAGTVSSTRPIRIANCGQKSLRTTEFQVAT